MLAAPRCREPGYPQVIAFPLALANGPTINLHLNGASTAAHSIQPGVGTPIAQRPAIPLDSLIPLFSRLDFIKMDTEGSEVDILVGATETLRKFRPHLAIEIHHTGPQVRQILESLGYTLHVSRIITDTPVSIEEYNGTDYGLCYARGGHT